MLKLLPAAVHFDNKETRKKNSVWAPKDQYALGAKNLRVLAGQSRHDHLEIRPCLLLIL